MTQEALNALIAWVALLTGYAPPDNFQVLYVPHAFLEAHACDRPCPVIGWTNPETMTIYIQDDQQTNYGLIVHEMTHIAQAQSGKFDLNLCADSERAEREAYAVQQAYAVQTGGWVDTRPHPVSCVKLKEIP